jgi:hypothetical protein
MQPSLDSSLPFLRHPEVVQPRGRDLERDGRGAIVYTWIELGNRTYTSQALAKPLSGVLGTSRTESDYGLSSITTCSDEERERTHQKIQRFQHHIHALVNRFHIRRDPMEPGSRRSTFPANKTNTLGRGYLLQEGMLGRRGN